MSDTTQNRTEGQNVFRDLWNVVKTFRGRIIAAVIFLVVAKFASVGVPLVLKRIVDVLSRPEQVAALPIVLLVGYALMRFVGTLFNELRDLAFARVTQHAVSTYALNTF